jgi:hypothetical protein
VSSRRRRPSVPPRPPVASVARTSSHLSPATNGALGAWAGVEVVRGAESGRGQDRVVVLPPAVAPAVSGGPLPSPQAEGPSDRLLHGVAVGVTGACPQGDEPGSLGGVQLRGARRTPAGSRGRRAPLVRAKPRRLRRVGSVRGGVRHRPAPVAQQHPPSLRPRVAAGDGGPPRRAAWSARRTPRRGLTCGWAEPHRCRLSGSEAGRVRGAVMTRRDAVLILWDRPQRSLDQYAFLSRLKSRPARSVPVTVPVSSRVKKPRCPFRPPSVMMYSSPGPGRNPIAAAG